MSTRAEQAERLLVLAVTLRRVAILSGPRDYVPTDAELERERRPQIEAVEAAEAGAAALLREQWHPIETAPKDGTEFWAHCVSGIGAPQFNQEVARWVEAPKGYTFGGRFATRSGNIPTHWYPLPPPPERSEP